MSRAKVAAKKGETIVHAVVDRREALLWLANQDCITLHVWGSRKGRLDKPDRLVFDLDPSARNFAAVRATARAVADVLGDLGLESFVKTTGSRGLHVVAPLSGDADFDTARQFARDVAAVVAADDPAHRTVEISKAKRGTRVYLDVMRNAYGQTAVAPYAVRARPGAPVATPLEWDELDIPGLRSDGFTIRDVPRRVAAQGDPWADIDRHVRSLSQPMQRLSQWRGNPTARTPRTD
jgi:bifunctional non-homologous end joining protein LigD